MTFELVPGASNSQGLRSLAPQGPPKDSKQSKARVLIVDDEPSICKALSMAMSRCGYDVIAAQSGESALAIIRNEHVDIMLIDLRIPDMRGDVIFEVAAGHQEHLRYQTLFLTGDLSERALKLISACRCKYLHKPFDLRLLETTVAALAPRVQDAAG
jgi:DNA-binding response OmpR family regulator